MLSAEKNKLSGKSNILSKILTASDCAACQFCCVFERASVWESPLFTKEQQHRLQEKFPAVKLTPCNGMYTVDFAGAYQTDKPEEEVPCPFLSSARGCLLEAEDKSFDCKIWPLRLMRKDDELVIALTPTCLVVNKHTAADLTGFIQQEKIDSLIFEFARKMPAIVKDYRAGFPVLISRQLK